MTTSNATSTTIVALQTLPSASSNANPATPTQSAPSCAPSATSLPTSTTPSSLNPHSNPASSNATISSAPTFRRFYARFATETITWSGVFSIIAGVVGTTFIFYSWKLNQWTQLQQLKQSCMNDISLHLSLSQACSQSISVPSDAFHVFGRKIPDRFRLSVRETSLVLNMSLTDTRSSNNDTLQGDILAGLAPSLQSTMFWSSRDPFYLSSNIVECLKQGLATLLLLIPGTILILALAFAMALLLRTELGTPLIMASRRWLTIVTNSASDHERKITKLQEALTEDQKILTDAQGHSSSVLVYKQTFSLAQRFVALSPSDMDDPRQEAMEKIGAYTHDIATVVDHTLAQDISAGSRGYRL